MFFSLVLENFLLLEMAGKPVGPIVFSAQSSLPKVYTLCNVQKVCEVLVKLRVTATLPLPPRTRKQFGPIDISQKLNLFLMDRKTWSAGQRTPGRTPCCMLKMTKPVRPVKTRSGWARTSPRDWTDGYTNGSGICTAYL